MKTIIITTSLFSLSLLYSCNKDCNCTSSWSSTQTYSKGDLVSWNGTCYKAVAQGRGIEPGPWMQNGNDIWEVCSGD